MINFYKMSRGLYIVLGMSVAIVTAVAVRNIWVVIGMMLLAEFFLMMSRLNDQRVHNMEKSKKRALPLAEEALK